MFSNRPNSFLRSALGLLILFSSASAFALVGPDPYFKKQTALQYARFQEGEALFLDEKTSAADPIIIGVIDKGPVNSRHEDFDAVLLPESENSGKDRYEWHGQYVAGILAARGNNATGIRGAISSHARVLYMQVRSPDDIIMALKKMAARGVSVVNISLGLNAPCSRLDSADGKCQEPLMENRRIAQAARDVMKDSNMILVTSAGNDHILIQPIGIEKDGLIVVGGMNKSGDLASYSNYGPAVSLFAPDFGIWGLSSESYRIELPATSFTTPLVTGAVAWGALYMKSHNVAYTPVLMKRLLLRSLRSQNGLKGKGATSGSLDLFNFASTLKKYVEASQSGTLNDTLKSAKVLVNKPRPKASEGKTREKLDTASSKKHRRSH